MKLSVHDRLLLLGLLPEKGDFVTTRMVRDLRQKIGFTSLELAAWQIKADEGRVTWNAQEAKEAEIELDGAEKALVVRQLTGLDEKKELAEVHLPLCDKFEYTGKK